MIPWGHNTNLVNKNESAYLRRETFTNAAVKCICVSCSESLQPRIGGVNRRASNHPSELDPSILAHVNAHVNAGTTSRRMTQDLSNMTNTSNITVRTQDRHVMVPRKVVREELIERTYMVPEKRQQEVEIMEEMRCREKVIERETVKVVDKVVEVPEVEIVEKVVEIQQAAGATTGRRTEKKVIEKTVEIPEIVYVEVPVEKIVEVPEIREKVTIKRVEVPHYVDKPVAQAVIVEQRKDVHRKIPIPVEHVQSYVFKLPRLRAHYENVNLPLHVPRFIEVPFPMDLMSTTVAQHAEHYAQSVAELASGEQAHLCQVENLAGAIKATDFGPLLSTQHVAPTILGAWETGKLEVEPKSWQALTGEPLPPTFASMGPATHTLTSTTEQSVRTM